MPIYKVLRLVDAWVDYVADVEADSPAEAAELASDNEGDYVWEEQGVREFDARGFLALDAAGDEIDDTRVGHF